MMIAPLSSGLPSYAWTCPDTRAGGTSLSRNSTRGGCAPALTAIRLA
jgi:hypothetical protein